MPEPAASPTTAPCDPENPAAEEDRSESPDTMPEDPSATPEPDQQAPDADTPEPDEETAADDEAETAQSDDELDADDDAPLEAAEVAPAEQVTKIVIWIRKGLATVGVQETGTDPEFATVASHDLDEIMPAITGIVRASREKWLTELQRKSAEPAPASGPRPAPTTRRAAANRNAPQTTTLQLF